MIHLIADSQSAGGTRQRAAASPQPTAFRSLPPLRGAPVRLTPADIARKHGKPVLPCADVNQRFGSRLRTMRCAHELTQQDMANQFGIDRSFISDMERGKKSVSLVTLEVLALGFGVTVSQLLADV